MTKRLRFMPGSRDRTPKESHPTKEALLDTVTRLLNESGPESLTVETVLLESGVSKGSLYYHFDDFSDLLEQTLVRRFSANVDKSISMLSGIVSTGQTKQQTVAALRHATAETTSSALAPIRLERAKVISYTADNPRLAARLGVEQARLTNTLAELFRELQDKGWMSNDFDARAAAVLTQSYALGRIVDDIDGNQVSDQAWCQLIDKIVDKVFMA